MGRWKAEKTIVKKVGDLCLIFYNKDTIYASEGDDGRWTIFHRWGTRLGFYGMNWRPFRHLLLYEKKINLAHCYHLAFRYEIQAQVTTRAPDLSGRIIEERIF